MNFLFDNPLVNLRGPAFLGVFAVVCVAAVIWARMRVRALDTTGQLPVPPIPPEIDPFDVAYLRGGNPELIRLTILALIARGYLRQYERKGATNQHVIGHLPDGSEPGYLNPTERFVFDWMRGDKAVSEIMSALPAAFERSGLGAPRQREMENQQLTRANQYGISSLNAILLPAGIVATLAIYKLLIAFSRGRTNVAFLIIMGLVTLFVILTAGIRPRLTNRGRAYFERVCDALGQLRDRRQTLVTAGNHDQLILAVAAFGMGLLEGTSYGYFPTMFERAATSSGGSDSSSGSSCGSSCGGGCGGGCGGCGS